MTAAEDADLLKAVEQLESDAEASRSLKSDRNVGQFSNGLRVVRHGSATIAAGVRALMAARDYFHAAADDCMRGDAVGRARVVRMVKDALAERDRARELAREACDLYAKFHGRESFDEQDADEARIAVILKEVMP